MINRAEGTRILSILNLIGFLLMISMNFLANYLPINNKTDAEISSQYPNLFVPAGYTFSIWGVIYLLLLGFVGYQLYQVFTNHESTDFIRKIKFWFFLSCIANAAWIIAWHHERIILSLAIMLTLLYTLIIVYDILNIGRSAVESKEKYFVHIPFSVYFAWINVATVANVTVAMVDSDWDQFGLSDQFWVFVLVILIFLLTLFQLIKIRDIYYLLVIIWAFTGILLQRLNDNSVSDAGIEWLLIILLAVLIVIGVIQAVRKKVY
jgi:hypothetical protein